MSCCRSSACARRGGLRWRDGCCHLSGVLIQHGCAYWLSPEQRRPRTRCAGRQLWLSPFTGCSATLSLSRARGRVRLSHAWCRCSSGASLALPAAGLSPDAGGRTCQRTSSFCNAAETSVAFIESLQVTRGIPDLVEKGSVLNHTWGLG